jgi:anti-sigma B factor antagonist
MFNLRSISYCFVPMPPFTLDVEKTAGSTESVAVYLLKGKLSLETVAEFLPKIRQETAQHVVVDMSGVNFLDSAGVGALVSLFVSRRNQGKTFALAALTPQATAVVTVAGLQKLLPVSMTVEEARASKS